MQELPIEIIMMVVENLDGKEFYRLRQTCRRITEITDADYFTTKRKCAGKYDLKQEKIASIFEIYCILNTYAISPGLVVGNDIAQKLYRYFLETRRNFTFRINKKRGRGGNGDYWHHYTFRSKEMTVRASVRYLRPEKHYKLMINDFVYCRNNVWSNWAKSQEHYEMAKELYELIKT